MFCMQSDLPPVSANWSLNQSLQEQITTTNNIRLTIYSLFWLFLVEEPVPQPYLMGYLKSFAIPILAITVGRKVY